MFLIVKFSDLENIFYFHVNIMCLLCSQWDYQTFLLKVVSMRATVFGFQIIMFWVTWHTVFVETWRICIQLPNLHDGGNVCYLRVDILKIRLEILLILSYSCYCYCGDALLLDRKIKISSLGTVPDFLTRGEKEKEITRFLITQLLSVKDKKLCAMFLWTFPLFKPP